MKKHEKIVTFEIWKNFIFKCCKFEEKAKMLNVVKKFPRFSQLSKTTQINRNYAILRLILNMKNFPHSNKTLGIPLQNDRITKFEN